MVVQIPNKSAESVEIEGETKIEVLSKCRQLLKFMNLGLKTKIQIGRVTIPNSVTFVVLSIPLCLSIVMESWFAYDIGLNLKEVTSPVLILLGTVQIVLIFFCLANDNSYLIQMIDHVQAVLNRSKWFLLWNLNCCK